MRNLRKENVDERFTRDRRGSLGPIRRHDPTLSHDLPVRYAFGHARLPGAICCWISCATTTRTRSFWSATSSTAGGCARLVLAAGAQRRHPETVAQGAQGRAHDLSCPATTTSSRAQFIGLNFGGIEIVRDAIHVAADGKRFLVMHGDEFDVVVRHARWLAFLGDWAYDAALFINTRFNAIRRLFGFGYWSFSAWAKLKVKNAVNFIELVRTELAGEAKRRGADGVVCGHIHHPDDPRHQRRDLREHRRLGRMLLARRRTRDGRFEV